MFEPGNHRGPARTYRPEHVVYLMILLRENRRMSRRSLAERMGIGEGTARSLVSFLTSKGMVWVSRRGVSLTDEGRGYVDGLNLLLVPLGVAGCGISLVAAVVKGVAGSVGDGLHPVFAATQTAV